MTEYPVRGESVPELLFVEPDSLIRSTVAGVCKQLNLARINQAASVSVAQQLLSTNAADLLLVSLNEGEAAISFLQRIRSGEWDSVAEVPLAVTSESAHEELIARIKPLAVKRLLLQPYKIKDVVLTIESLLQAIEEES